MGGTFFPSGAAFLNTRTVGVGGQYPTITAAMADASSGDEVVADGGTYTESFTIPDGVTLTAPAARIVGNITAGAGCVINVYSVTGNGILSGTGTIWSYGLWTGNVTLSGTSTWIHTGDVTGNLVVPDGCRAEVTGDVSGSVTLSGSGTAVVGGNIGGAIALTGTAVLEARGNAGSTVNVAATASATIRGAVAGAITNAGLLLVESYVVGAVGSSGNTYIRGGVTGNATLTGGIAEIAGIVGDLTTSGSALVSINAPLLIGNVVSSGTSGVIHQVPGYMTGNVTLTDTATADLSTVAGNIDSGNGTKAVIRGDLTGNSETNTSGSVKVYGDQPSGANTGTGLLWVAEDRIDLIERRALSNW
ncbi:MAG: hypothetical protein ABIJ75_10250 [Actinomycetota bacterium]